MFQKVKILDVNVDIVTMNNALDIIDGFIFAGVSRLIATANAEMIMLAQTDNELREILNTADMVVPDGAGVVWAGRYLGVKVPERVAGYDLTQNLLKKAARSGYTVFMLGAGPGIAVRAKSEAERRFPGIQIVGVQDGYFSPTDEPKIIESIRSLHPDILLVALGVPKQEKWIYYLKDCLGVPVAIGVGGTFDVMAGTVKRAPVWMQKVHLEWLFRFLMQPTRFRRILKLPQFVIKVLTAKKVRQNNHDIL